MEINQKNIISIIILILSIILGISSYTLFIKIDNYINIDKYLIEEIEEKVEYKSGVDLYEVYINGDLAQSFENYDNAYDYAINKKRATIMEKGNEKILWDNYPRYRVKLNNMETEFNSFENALKFAKQNENSLIINSKTGDIIWEKDFIKEESILIDVPLIKQMPELPRGCEVTSLGMLINYNGIDVDKMDLAEKVKKNPNKLKIVDGKKYFGNPYNGFVGDMYSFRNDGLGVFHRPIFELLKEYFPDRAVDYTGSEFTDLYYSLNNNQPLWIIINSTYKPLEYAEDPRIQTWITEDGEMEITYRQHSVLVTGYDKDYIYFNDPLGYEYKGDKEEFILAWEEMGRQSVGLSPKD